MDFYSKVCNFIGNIFRLNISFGKDSEKKLQELIDFAGLQTTAKNIYNTAIFFALISIIFLILFIISGRILFGFLFLLAGFGSSFFVIYYPNILARYIRITAAPDLILTILYMIISLRVIPNLENALYFAAKNVKGYIGNSLKKLVWKVQIGEYSNIDKALEDFALKFKVENEEFYDAIEIIRASVLKPENERLKMYEEALSIILERNLDRLKAYAQELKTPITLITYMGIILPVLVTTLIPILTSFIQTNINPWLLVALYNVAIPLIIIFFNNIYLRTFPTFLSEIEFEKHPRGNKIGFLKISNINLPLLPISVLITILFSWFGYNLIIENKENPLLKLLGAELIIVGLIIAIVIYSFFSYYRNIKIRDEIKSVEDSFMEGLFNFGNILSIGYSVENSLEKLVARLKGIKAYDFFNDILTNIKVRGVTFHRAIFDENFGVIKNYRSSLIENTMRIISEGLKLGSRAVSQSVVTISNYLKSVKKIEIYSKEIFEDITSEIKILTLLLIPLFTGIITGISGIISDVMDFLHKFTSQFTQLQNQTGFGGVGLGFGLSFKSLLPIETFALIFGIYMIEINVISIIFLSNLESQKDKIAKYQALTKILIISLILYMTSSILLYALIQSILPLSVPIS